MTEEIWKPVPSKPGVMASSWGRIKLPESKIEMPNGGVRIYKTKPVYGSICRSNRGAKHEYRNVMSKQFGNLKIHRMVCEAFHGAPPFDRAVVIHLDENGLNNKPENLKWGTQKENLNMPKFIEYCRSRTGENSPSHKGKMAKQS
jgi:hypothetical protein